MSFGSKLWAELENSYLERSLGSKRRLYTGLSINFLLYITETDSSYLKEKWGVYLKELDCFKSL